MCFGFFFLLIAAFKELRGINSVAVLVPDFQVEVGAFVLFKGARFCNFADDVAFLHGLPDGDVNVAAK